VGTCCLYKGATKKNLPLLIVAGASLGLGFNFRSEVIILAGFYFVALSAHVLRTGGNLGSKVKHLVSFAAVVVIFTIPWLVYTKLTVGHSLLTSTNSGAVTYLGLGALPDNPWGIIPNDDYAWDIARDQGLESPWGFDADRFFTNRFIEAVNAHPPSFLHRILTGWRLMFMQGLYFPDFRHLFLIDPGNHDLQLPKDYIPYDYLNEKLKEALHLKIDDSKLKRYQIDGVGFHQVQFRHWLILLGEYSVRGIFALVFLCTVGALFFRVIRSRTWDLCITLPLACLGFELFIAGFIQTLPSHTTQVWPVLIVFELQSARI
jgi:4-amino-4-deoxy-L-arabinose transferase-like glycosyltransferase